MFGLMGAIFQVLTFPGVIVHEMAHQLFCRLARVAVLEVVYFRLGRPAGYVVHETPRSAWQSLLIGIGPFLVNSVLGAVIAAPAATGLPFGETGGAADFVLLWLGISIAAHAFPSTGDAHSIWQSTTGTGVPAGVKLVAVPVVGLIYLGALGAFFWLDLAYGVLVAGALPQLLASLAAG